MHAFRFPRSSYVIYCTAPHPQLSELSATRRGQHFKQYVKPPPMQSAAEHWDRLSLTKNHQVVSKLLSYHVTRRISISFFYRSKNSELFDQKNFVSSELSIFPSAVQCHDASVQTQLFCRYTTVNLHCFMH